MNPPKRYHPALVTLHWLTVLLVVTNLYLGIVVFEDRGGREDFEAMNVLVAIHMLVGVSLLALLVIRFIVRMTTSAPLPVTAGNRFLDMLAGLVHGGLYVAILAVTVLGLVFSLQSGRFQSAFLGAGGGFPNDGEMPRDNSGSGNSDDQDRDSDGDNSGPGDSDNQGRGSDDDRRGPGGRDDDGNDSFNLLEFHELAAYTLLGLASLHILAAFYHQFILRDNLIARMWYGER